MSKEMKLIVVLVVLLFISDVLTNIRVTQLRKVMVSYSEVISKQTELIKSISDMNTKQNEIDNDIIDMIGRLTRGLDSVITVLESE